MWAILAIAASICWGLGYALSEKLLHNGVTPAFMLFIISLAQLPVFFFWASYSGGIKPSIEILQSNPKYLMYSMITLIAFLLGNIFIVQAISMKNATYVNLIEITYPIFTILFMFLLFKTIHLNISSAIGAGFILLGVILLLYKG